MKPPSEIDGAEVLEWAWSGEVPFGLLKYQDGTVASKIFGLAICRYRNSNAIYRFSCNEKWESEQDSDYSTISEAKAALPNQYKDIKAVWHKIQSIHIKTKK